VPVDNLSPSGTSGAQTGIAIPGESSTGAILYDPR